MENLLGEKIKVKKPKEKQPLKVYQVTDEEFCYFFVARSPGDARQAYVSESGMYSFDETFDAIRSIVRVPILDGFIKKEPDFSYTINHWEDEHWTRAVYEVGGHFYQYGGCENCEESDDEKLTLREMLDRKCRHGEALNDEQVYIDIPKK